MPKKRKSENNLGRLIRALDLSQTEFARILGVSASSIKKVVGGTRALSDDLRARIFAETGIMFFSAAEETPMEFTKEELLEFKKQILFNENQSRYAAGILSKSLELMMIAASRPGVQKSFSVFSALGQAIAKVKNEFHMEKHIDAVLRERNSTETKLYTVRELRDNSILAEQTGFKDNPALNDEQKIPLTRTVGWLPAKDIFNVMWKQREFLCEILKNQSADLTDEAKAKLEEMAGQVQKQFDEVVYASYPDLRPR